MRPLRLFLLSVAALSSASLAAAQAPTPAPTLAAAPEAMVGNVRGPRVRFETAGSEWQVGVLATQDSARFGFVLEAAAETTWVSRSQVRNMEVSVGQRHPVRTAVTIGALFGAAIGAAAAAASYTPCTSGGFACIGDMGPGMEALGGGLAGAGVGALLGLVVGNSITTDEWRRVNDAPVRIGVAPARGGVGIGIAIRIR